MEDIEKYGERIGNSERQLKVLNEKKTEIEEYVSGLQGLELPEQFFSIKFHTSLSIH